MSRPVDNAARSAHRVLSSAQDLAALLLRTGGVERLDRTTEEGRALLALLDAVDEYEGHAAGLPPDARGPVTLW